MSVSIGGHELTRDQIKTLDAVRDYLQKNAGDSGLSRVRAPAEALKGVNMPRHNWDKLTGPYKKFHDALWEADQRWRVANRFVLSDDSLVPQSCIDVWLCPNGKVLLVQRWPEGGFQHYQPFQASKMEDVIAETLNFGAQSPAQPALAPPR